MNDPIKIRGHYGAHTCSLNKVSDNSYELELVDDFCRFGLAEGGGYFFVDPSGGPFMAVGESLRRFHKDLPDTPIRAIERDETGIVIVT